MIVRTVEGGVHLSVRVQPRARTTGTAGPYGERAIRIRVSSPPVDGAANDELVEFLADLFDRPPSSVEIVRGHASRDKVVRVPAVSTSDARRALGL